MRRLCGPSRRARPSLELSNCSRYYVSSHLQHHIDFVSHGIGSPVSPHRKSSSERSQKRQQLPPGLPPPDPGNSSLQDCWKGIFPHVSTLCMAYLRRPPMYQTTHWESSKPMRPTCRVTSTNSSKKWQRRSQLAQRRTISCSTGLNSLQTS